MKAISELINNKAIWKYDNSKLHVQTSESGLHSDLYLNTDYVVSDVSLVEKIVEDIFFKDLQARKIKPDWIISYPPFGLAIAYALARKTGARFGYVDRENEACDFDVKKGDKIIVVGDDIYSGGSIKETIEIMKKIGAKVQTPIFTIGNFSGTKKILGLEVVSAISEKGNLYPAKDCPMCKSGSKAVLPRPNWNELMKKNGEDSMGINEWLKSFKKYWIGKDMESVLSLFSADVEYLETPERKLKDTNEIKSEWAVVKNQDEIELKLSLIGNVDEIYDVEWKLSYNKQGQEYKCEGVYKIRLNEHGKCNYFMQIER